MQNPLVSIIVTIYNKQDYIRTCVNSLISQTYKNLQIIVVNDGSTDKSPLICDELAVTDARITVLHQENKGMCPARNAGLDIARGEWICILDGDDYVDEKYVECLLNAAISNGTLIAQCAYKYALTRETAIEQLPYKCSVIELTELIANNYYNPGFNNLSLCDKIYHKSLFDNIRLPNTKNGMDVTTICELLYTAKARKFVVVNQILFFYRQTPNSMARSKRSLFTLDVWRHNYIDPMNFWKNKGFIQIYNIFFKYAYTISVVLAMECIRDMPEHSDKSEAIIEYVKNNIDEAIFIGCNDLTVRYGSKQLWNSIVSNPKGVVMYGYGSNGRDIIYPWLKYFNVEIKEIWDTRANNEDTIDTIPFRKANDKFDKDILIIIAIYDKFISSQVEIQLRNLGYTNFIAGTIAYDAIRYASFEKFMPFLLEERHEVEK